MTTRVIYIHANGLECAWRIPCNAVMTFLDVLKIVNRDIFMKLMETYFCKELHVCKKCNRQYFAPPHACKEHPMHKCYRCKLIKRLKWELRQASIDELEQAFIVFNPWHMVNDFPFLK